MAAYVKLKNGPAFERAFKLWYGNGKKTARDAALVQARGMTKHLMKVTPPGGGNGTVNSSWQVGLMKKRGEATVKKQLSMTAVPVADEDRSIFGLKRGWATESDLRRHHSSKRKAGRVRGRPTKKAFPAKIFRKYLKSRKDNVGTLQAGWMRAARVLGVKGIPAFISRHRSHGRYNIKVSDREIIIKITNGVRYSGDLSVMVNRINWAVGKQAHAMNKTSLNHAANNARRAGFKIDGAGAVINTRNKS